MKNLCVIFGGRSPEHDISRLSVTSILNNLDKTKYNISVIGITKDGKWLLYNGNHKNIADGSWEKDSENLKKAIISPDTSDKAIIVFENNNTVSYIYPDVVFPVLHGEYGEDGTIQGLFELADIKYVGMGVLASANAMDKIYSKLVFANAGIPQADWVTVCSTDVIDDKVTEIEEKLGYPNFVKPSRTGSSVGVGKAHNQQELYDAIKNALLYDRKVLVEECIDGREVECSVLGNADVKAGEVGEIIPVVEFYDFDAKYTDDSTKLEIPAKLSEQTKNAIQEYAIRAFKALDGQGLSRVDFFVKHSDGSIILNEINTLPGFTNISMYPKLWEAAGIGYCDLLDKLIELAEERVK